MGSRRRAETRKEKAMGSYEQSAESEARRQAGCLRHDSVPVVVDAAHVGAPTEQGEPYHWETPGGARCRFPGAYRRACGNPVYVHSRRRVIVSPEWWAAHVAVPAAGAARALAEAIRV
jgi:hypothetical protein